MKQSFSRAFTLIELLIVVAIIAILAAIAVPNFLEAQTRSKVSRAKADMRSMATAIEAYQVDNNRYPSIVARHSPLGPDPQPNASGINGPSVFEPGFAGVSSRFVYLTTPIAYITSVFRDPFINPAIGWALAPASTGKSPLDGYDTYDYVDAATLGPNGVLSAGNRGASVSSGAAWHLVSAGPDLRNAFGGGYAGQSPVFAQQGVDYDPSNGTISAGDIVRIGGGPGILPDPVGRVPAYDRVKNEYNVDPETGSAI